jgi:hypothetical protein
MTKLDKLHISVRQKSTFSNVAQYSNLALSSDNIALFSNLRVAEYGNLHWGYRKLRASILGW